MRVVVASRAPLLVALVALALHAHAVAQNLRSIPRTPKNEEFFALAQSLLSGGDFQQSSCGAQRPDLEQCIRTCNSPGPQEREGCCCIIDDGSFFVGVRGGCRYNQRIQNFTQSFIYKSTPINSNVPYFDKITCSFTDEDANDESCTCTLQWEASSEKLDLMSPIPTPSSSPSPVLSPPMSVPPIRTPEPVETPDDTPTVEPTTAPTIVTPPTAVTSAPPVATPAPTEESASMPTEPTFSPPLDDEERDPSVTPDDDDPVCVDQSYLLSRGYDASQLVHTRGVLSRVLCPQHGGLPCASAHHKVRYAGRDVSYRQLCELHAHMRCERAEMVVNSVFSHAWREVLHGEVWLTMFDARYAELPQQLLHATMHQLRLVKRGAFAWLASSV